eukprot:CAMPEP_0203913276 /NCGR_PEP_ID=MMETSP0359-20131031/54294_1 /ASSEMBLY_ACC=CAM_ASM_000338 /TAXON_ID=268821 /ORGANISM="Scrippsiella Hangoei, Strain SHTV-5" /LENGTH=46 /DNA_ID= /DNA_START= /DNA_END= /DNA_ORIENTATION=
MSELDPTSKLVGSFGHGMIAEQQTEPTSTLEPTTTTNGRQPVPRQA